MADSKRDDDARHEAKSEAKAAPPTATLTEGEATPTSEPEVARIEVSAEVMHLAYLLEQPPEVLAFSLDGKLPDGSPDPNAVALTEGQIAGLLETERSGKNRTDTVNVLCTRLGIATPYEVTSAGPNYTNPVNRDVVAPVTPPV
jgi:hypothetical protein